MSDSTYYAAARIMARGAQIIVSQPAGDPLGLTPAAEGVLEALRPPPPQLPSFPSHLTDSESEIVSHLRDRGPLTTREVADATGLKPKTVARTLRQLREAGVVVSEDEGPRSAPLKWTLLRRWAG